MFKKMLPWVIMFLVVITLIVVAAFLLWDKLFSDTAAGPNDVARQSVEEIESARLSAEEIKELSVDMNDMLTNLTTGDFIKISFTFVLSSEKAKSEFELLDFKIKHIVNLTLADLSPDDVKGSQGYDLLSSTLINRINQELREGKVREVLITNLVIS